MNQTPMIDTKEAASYLQIHIMTLYRLVKTKEIPACRVGGRIKFSPEVLDAWMMRKLEESSAIGGGEKL